MKVVVTGAGDRQVGLDTATGVQELGVDDLARFLVHVRYSQVLQRFQRTRSGNAELTERGLVNQSNPFAHSLMFFCDEFVAITTQEAGFLILGLPFGNEEVGTFPTSARSPGRTLFIQGVV